MNTDLLVQKLRSSGGRSGFLVNGDMIFGLSVVLLLAAVALFAPLLAHVSQFMFRPRVERGR
jgi:hypothetical protein